MEQKSHKWWLTQQTSSWDTWILELTTAKRVGEAEFRAPVSSFWMFPIGSVGTPIVSYAFSTCLLERERERELSCVIDKLCVGRGFAFKCIKWLITLESAFEVTAVMIYIHMYIRATGNGVFELFEVSFAAAYVCSMRRIFFSYCLVRRPSVNLQLKVSLL